MTKKKLVGKNIVITGGSRSLGQAICIACAEQGAQYIAFTYRNDDSGAEQTCSKLQALGVKADAYKIANTDYDKTCSMFQDLESNWGQVDILINNAGVNQMLPIALLDEEDWDYVMDINVKGTFLTSKAALRGMVRRKAGVILNIGSLAGVRIMETPIHYTASKAAINGLTMAMAKELAPYNIRINCFAPGLLEEGVGANIPENRLKDYLTHCSLGRLGSVQEAASFIAFTVSDGNSYMSGETVVMDGGV